MQMSVDARTSQYVTATGRDPGSYPVESRPPRGLCSLVINDGSLNSQTILTCNYRFDLFSFKKSGKNTKALPKRRSAFTYAPAVNPGLQDPQEAELAVARPQAWVGLRCGFFICRTWYLGKSHRALRRLRRCRMVLVIITLSSSSESTSSCQLHQASGTADYGGHVLQGWQPALADEGLPI